MRALPFVLLAGVTSALPAQVVPTQGDRPPVISSSGEGQQTVAPDQVTIFVAVQTRAKAAINAGAENAEKMAAVMKALRGLGLEEREMSTAVYSLHPETWRNPNDTVYVANNGIRVETKKLELVSRIIDTAMTAGANNIGSLQYGLSDSKPAESEALAEAVRNARARAEAMATAAGGRLGALEELTSQTEGYRPFMDGTMNVQASGRMEAVPTPITPREITVTARVTARWRFVPGS